MLINNTVHIISINHDIYYMHFLYSAGISKTLGSAFNQIVVLHQKLIFECFINFQYFEYNISFYYHIFAYKITKYSNYILLFDLKKSIRARKSETYIVFTTK